MTLAELAVRRREPSDERAVEAFLEERSALRVARLGTLEHPLEHPALMAERGGLRFYQRRGFRLAALHRGAVDESRARVKPQIPQVGVHGIELRDELELDKVPHA